MGELLLVLIGQPHQIQRVLYGIAARNAPQSRENLQVLRGRQVRVESRRFDKAADAGGELSSRFPEGAFPIAAPPRLWAA